MVCRELRETYAPAFAYRDNLGMPQVDSAKLNVVLEHAKQNQDHAVIYALVHAPQNYLTTDQKASLLTLDGRSNVEDALTLAKELEAFYNQIKNALAPDVPAIQHLN
jgi:hypothetical protein